MKNKPGDCKRARRWATEARRQWYAFYRTLRHQRRLFKEFALLEGEFQGQLVRIDEYREAA